ncbi:MAG: glycosyltransferase involved in cell wall biosynthesis [bacterium]|jgi:glycosyltransferase involved in cell wall biosynthesis
MENTSKEVADICFFLEGTYPFVSGGVSTWVHSLIQGLSEFTFALVLIMPDEQVSEMKYELPPNVVSFDVIPLFRKEFNQRPILKKTFSKKTYQKIREFHESIPKRIFGRRELGAGVSKSFGSMLRNVHKDSWNIQSALYAKSTWNFMTSIYHSKSQDCSFVDYVSNWKYLHTAIFSILRFQPPKAKVYHTISTGYAGLLGAKSSITNQVPLFLTEHGIYNKERKIEIARSPWIFEKYRHLFRAEEETEIFKSIWMNAFHTMSKLCYDTSSEIITLFSGNQKFQLEDGADPEKMRVIPNGVYYDQLSKLKKEPQENKIIGFVGRVVPIKDVKTFIRAVSIVINAYPESEAWILGPTDEDQEYFDECKSLVDHLGLSAKIKFFGIVNILEFYPKLDVLVLTSISEAQPLVVLEGYSLGIPVVVTDVGSCKELVEGLGGEDKALGISGIVTGMTNPSETALGILYILKNEDEAKKMGEVAKKRVKQFYDMPILFESYRSLYQKYMTLEEA